MRPVLTAEQSRQQDTAATTPADVLLDRAGLAVAIEVAHLGIGYGNRIAVLTGPGNNGGDGYVAAGYLRRRGVAVDLYPSSPPASEPAIRARHRALASGAVERGWNDPRSCDLVVDALFGGGFRGELPDVEPWRSAPAVLAVDVPSGVSATSGAAVDGVLAAQRSVTFHGPKVGHLFGPGRELSGELRVVDIGLPDVEPEMWLCEESDAPLPTRSVDSNKWTSGSVLVVGGSKGLDGAATLAARAALRTGAGAVMIVCPASVEDRVRAPEIMTRAVGDGDAFEEAHAAEVLDLAGRFDSVVLGPGLGQSVDGFVSRLVAGHRGRLLVDADGLNALDGPAALKRQGETVVTPHAGEFRRLTGADADFAAAVGLAEETSAVVLLKGGPTVVAGAGDRWVVDSGGPELATIGTGDVLAGMIAALWSAGLDALAAARSAAFWHGRAAGELARTQVVTADALVDQVAITTRR